MNSIAGAPLRQILERAYDFNVDAYYTLIAFKASYNSVYERKLYEAII